MRRRCARPRRARRSSWSLRKCDQIARRGKTWPGPAHSANLSPWPLATLARR
jgi:hypothetical protein